MILDQQKLISLDYLQVSETWQKYLKHPPLHLIGSINVRKKEIFIPIIWILILLLASILFGFTFFQHWQQEKAQVELNGELIDLGWQQSKVTILVIGFYLLLPLSAILLIWNLLRLHITPRILIWLTKEGLNIYQNNDNHFFPWKSFSSKEYKFRPSGTAYLPLRTGKEFVMIKNIKDPADFFQLLDMHISGNSNLVQYHAFKEEINTTKSRKYFFRQFLSGLLYLIKPLTIIFIGLPLAAIPFIFIAVVHLKDDGNLIFRLFEYMAVLIVSIFTLAAFNNILKSIYLEYRSKLKSQLWKISSFLHSAGIFIYGLSFFIFYNCIDSLTFKEKEFFERLYYLFYSIIAFFCCLLLLIFIIKQIKPYLKPVLVLRQFGVDGLTGSWSLSLSPNEYDMKKNSDVFLHQTSRMFKIKKIYAYYDHRLEKGGLQDNAAEYFLQSKEWLIYVEACAKIAQAVIIVPGTTESLIMEMKMLRDQELLDKTFVLMPPEKEGDATEKQWENIREQLTDWGFHLPFYEEGGMIYQPNYNYSNHFSWKLHNDINNIFFVNKLKGWQVCRYSVYDQIYKLNKSFANKSLKDLVDD